MWEKKIMILFNEIFFFFLFPILIRVIILIIGVWGLHSSKFLKEKNEAYECGFDPFLKKKSSFCIRFFNIAILYLLIDLEIALLLPFFLKNLLLRFFLTWTVRFRFLLILILFILLLIEYGWGGLRWDQDL
jgi:NADH-quinone oxidoreductase subunit A